MIASRLLSGNGPHLAWRGEPPEFSRVSTGSLDCDGDLRDPHWCPQERTVPMELLGCLSGFLSRRCWSLRPCVESVPKPEDSCPVLTWILGYSWSLPRGVSPRFDWGHARAISSLDGAAVSCFPSSGSRNQLLSLEAFPQGFITRLSHRALPRASVV